MRYYFYCPRCKDIYGMENNGEDHDCPKCGRLLKNTDIRVDDWDGFSVITRENSWKKWASMYPDEPDGYLLGMKIGDLEKIPPFVKKNLEKALICDALTQTNITYRGKTTTFRARFGGAENLGAMVLLIKCGFVNSEKELHKKIKNIRQHRTKPIFPNPPTSDIISIWINR